MRTLVVVLERREPVPAAGAPAGQVPLPQATSGAVLVHPLDDLASLPDRIPASVPVLVISERVASGLLGRACGLLAAAVDVPVASRALPHGPLAVRMLAELVVRLDLSPASAVAVLDELAATTWSGAWLPSVAGLEAPTPTIGQHLRSWLPGGSGYLVEHHPRPLVRPVAGGHPTPQENDGLRPVLTVAGQGAPVEALDQAQRLASARTRTVVAPVSDVASRYGTGYAVELAALPGSVPAVTGTGVTCDSCGLVVVTAACPFCHRTPAAVILVGTA